MVPIFEQDTTCPALLIELTAHARFCVRGCHPVSRAPFQTLPTSMLIQALGSSRSLAAATGESRLISFPRGAKVVQFPGSPH